MSMKWVPHLFSFLFLTICYALSVPIIYTLSLPRVVPIMNFEIALSHSPCACRIGFPCVPTSTPPKHIRTKCFFEDRVFMGVNWSLIHSFHDTCVTMFFSLLTSTSTIFFMGYLLFALGNVTVFLVDVKNYSPTFAIKLPKYNKHLSRGKRPKN